MEFTSIGHDYTHRHSFINRRTSVVPREFAVSVVYYRTKVLPVWHIKENERVVASQRTTLQQSAGHDTSINFAACAAVQHFDCHNPRFLVKQKRAMPNSRTPLSDLPFRALDRDVSRPYLLPNSSAKIRTFLKLAKKKRKKKEGRTICAPFYTGNHQFISRNSVRPAALQKGRQRHSTGVATG